MHARRAGERTVTFGVSGALWKDAMVMFDRETGSLWSHVTGACIEGALEGTTLRALPSRLLPFSEWLALHPSARFVVRPAGSSTGSRYEGYAASDRQGIFGTQAARRELRPKAIVQGVTAGGEAAAIAHESVRRRREMTFSLGGEQFLARHEHGGVAVWRKGPGGTLEPWPSTTAYWFAWLNFYPRAKLVR